MAQTRKNKLVRNVKKMRNAGISKVADKLEKFSNPSPAAIKKCEKGKKKILSMSEEKMNKVMTKKMKAKLALFKFSITDSKLKGMVKKTVAKTRKMMKNMDCKNPLAAILEAAKPTGDAQK